MFFWCVNRLKSALSTVSVCERFTCRLRWQSPSETVSAKKLPEKIARLCRTLLTSNRGMQCALKLHHYTCRFYTQKVVFENTVNISQNERLS